MSEPTPKRPFSAVSSPTTPELDFTKRLNMSDTPPQDGSANPTGTYKMPEMPKDIPDWARAMFTHLSSALNGLSTKIDNIDKNTAQSLERLTDKVRTCEEEVSTMKRSIQQQGELVSSLQSTVQNLSLENTDLKERIIKQECRSRRDNLRIIGITEVKGESDSDCSNKVLDVVKGFGFSPNGHDFKIARCHRLGRYKNGFTRPIVVKFELFSDRMKLWNTRKRKQMNEKGIYIQEDFPIEIDARRKRLYPVLKKALQMTKYQGKVKLAVDKLIICGKTFTVNNLHDLPDELSLRSLCEATNDEVLCFFHSDTPLSNFHPAEFMYEGTKYTSAEQAFQHSKALCFHDQDTANKIMKTPTPEKQKGLGYRVKDFDENIWNFKQESIMHDIVFAKFSQNDQLRKYLIDTNGKVLGEANPADVTFGIGLRLRDSTVLDTRTWRGNNVLGRTLMTVRGMLK